jgi:hypothetical protein
MGLMGQNWPLFKAKRCQFVANCCHGLPIAASGSKLLPHDFPIMANGLPVVVLKSNCRLKFGLNGLNWPKLA